MSIRTGFLPALLLVALVALISPGRAQAAVQCGAPDQTGSYVCSIDPALDPAALCNDGSVPKFWVRPGSGVGAANWVIWLQGGGDCADQTACAERAGNIKTARLLTSRGFHATLGYGVLSATGAINPNLFNANTVMVHYCSSDDWSGAYTPTAAFKASDPTTWYFQGRRIALAVINSMNELNLGFSNASLIVLGGSSAGGIGITVDANDILPILPPAHTVLLANDAGFTIDVGQFDITQPPPYMATDTPTAFDVDYTNALSLWHGRGDAKCAAAAATTQQSVACYSTALVLQNNDITVPVFVAESQIDEAQIVRQLCPTIFGQCPVPTNPAWAPGQYATAFGVKMAAALIGSGTAAQYGVASPDVYEHEILDNPETFVDAFAIPGGTTTVRDVWNAWFANVTGPRVVVIGNAPGVAVPSDTTP